MEKQNKKKIFKLILSIVLTLLIGFIGSLITNKSLDTWYNTIKNLPLIHQIGYLLLFGQFCL